MYVYCNNKKIIGGIIGLTIQLQSLLYGNGSEIHFAHNIFKIVIFIMNNINIFYNSRKEPGYDSALWLWTVLLSGKSFKLRTIS